MISRTSWCHGGSIYHASTAPILRPTTETSKVTSTEDSTKTPMNNALYTLYRFLRVAINVTWHDKFFLMLKKELETIRPAAKADPVFKQNGCINVGPESETAQENRQTKGKLRLKETVPAPAPNATTKRPIERRKATAEPVVAAQAAPPSRNTKCACSSGCSDRTAR
ncbi:hypothetical protein CPB85DRAFT_601410 [Mucidula mucida]|nr:hypothetical protein CPB85DRAFT_601410 [Mucidula mucida]